MGIDRESLVKALNLLPYPFLLSERRQGTQQNIFVNQRFRDELGYSCEEIPTINDWFDHAYPDPEYRYQLFERWNELIEKAKVDGTDSVAMQARIQTKHAGFTWYEVKASLLGRINFVVFVNIQEEINRERALEQLNENKNRILSILSHDLRSPLTSLRAVLNMVAGNVISLQEEHMILKKISAQVFQMTELLDTTLQWSKANFNEIHCKKVSVNIKPIVWKYLNLYQDSIQEKHIEITECISPNMTIHSDPEIISIALRNLISNAIKYTVPFGTIRLQESRENDWHVVTVENTGTGISHEKIMEILQRSSTSEPGTKGEVGLGLGLRLCQQLLDKVGGHLRIESANNHATFRIALPICSTIPCPAPCQAQTVQ